MKSKPNTRDIGLNHGAGKGDANRTTNIKVFKSNFDLIDWGAVDTFHDINVLRKGTKLIKKYG